ncbi:MAG: inositol monophosphatase [SAR202 cluster bacterium]|nr:inositol monophosphatase [SAR202 cluster bacterium]
MEELPKGRSGSAAAEVAQDAARLAGRILVERFGQVKQVTFKGRGNVVTDVDKEVEVEVIALLQREYPGMSILGEESAARAQGTGGPPGAGKGYTWIVDPLDGTRNYASGIPHYSVVVALARDGEPVVGVNHDPVRDELFFAERGKGAFLNGQRIRVSQRTALDDCIFGSDLSYQNEGAANGLKLLVGLWPGMQTVRIMGSAALGLSWAACGRVDLFFHHQLEPWDQVAGILLAQEAGGVATDRTGQPAALRSDGIIATSPALLREFLCKTDGMAWRNPTHRKA